MPQPPHDPLEPHPVKPIKAHVHVLAIAAVSPLTVRLAERLTVYGQAFCYKLLRDLVAIPSINPMGRNLQAVVDVNGEQSRPAGVLYSHVSP